MPKNTAALLIPHSKMYMKKYSVDMEWCMELLPKSCIDTTDYCLEQIMSLFTGLQNKEEATFT